MDTTLIITVLGSNLLAAIVAAVVSLVTAHVSKKQMKLTFYSQTISGERMNWINRMREQTAELAAFCCRYADSALSDEHRSEFERIRVGILLMITPMRDIIEISDPAKQTKVKSYYEHDLALWELLNGDYQSVRDNIKAICELVACICKSEWRRIKAEAGGDQFVEAQVAKSDRAGENKRLQK